MSVVFWLAALLTAVVAYLTLRTAFFVVVDNGSAAVITRHGKHAKTLATGTHFVAKPWGYRVYAWLTSAQHSLKVKVACGDGISASYTVELMLSLRGLADEAHTQAVYNHSGRMRRPTTEEILTNRLSFVQEETERLVASFLMGRSVSEVALKRAESINDLLPRLQELADHAAFELLDVSFVRVIPPRQLKDAIEQSEAAAYANQQMLEEVAAEEKRKELIEAGEAERRRIKAAADREVAESSRTTAEINAAAKRDDTKAAAERKRTEAAGNLAAAEIAERAVQVQLRPFAAMLEALGAAGVSKQQQGNVLMQFASVAGGVTAPDSPHLSQDLAETIPTPRVRD